MDFREIVHDRYIKPAESKVGRKPLVGSEVEMPIIRTGDPEQAVDRKGVAGIMPMLESLDFKPYLWTLAGDTVCARSAGGATLCFDSSFQNFEFSLAPRNSLSEINAEFTTFFTFINQYLHTFGHELSGHGISRVNNREHYSILMKKTSPGRAARTGVARDVEYQFLLDNCQPPFHSYPDLFSFISSTQLHIDVPPERIPLALNVYSRLDAISMLLFSNSRAVLDGREYLCGRHYLYSRSPFAELGAAGTIDRKLHTLDDVMDMYSHRRIVGRYRNDAFELLEHPVELRDYFSDPKYNADPDDMQEMFSFCYSELSKFGTIERRVNCTQPVGETFLPCAFELGLVYKLDEADELMSRFFAENAQELTNSELCDIAARPGCTEFFDFKWSALAEKLAELSYDGLAHAHPGDEELLLPLEKRIGGFRSPAAVEYDAIHSGK